MLLLVMGASLRRHIDQPKVNDLNMAFVPEHCGDRQSARLQIEPRLSGAIPGRCPLQVIQGKPVLEGPGTGLHCHLRNWAKLGVGQAVLNLDIDLFNITFLQAGAPWLGECPAVRIDHELRDVRRGATHNA